MCVCVCEYNGQLSKKAKVIIFFFNKYGGDVVHNSCNCRFSYYGYISANEHKIVTEYYTSSTYTYSTVYVYEPTLVGN